MMVDAPNAQNFPSSAQDLGVPDTHRDRHGGTIRMVGAVATGFLVSIFIINSLQVGVSLALGKEDQAEWTFLLWGNHWAWRAAAAIAATASAGFLAGMVARRRGARAAILSALPSAAYWAVIVYVGWSGRAGGFEPIPIGYRIIAVILAMAILPIAGAAGSAGSPYGRANAIHFDSRRASLLGVHWYHLFWLPFLAYAMLIATAFGVVYGLPWLLLTWKMGASVLIIVPLLFWGGMLGTLALLAQGAYLAYEALAGFDDEPGQPVWKRVLKYGIGYTVATGGAQFTIALLHHGLTLLIARFNG